MMLPFFLANATSSCSCARVAAAPVGLFGEQKKMMSAYRLLDVGNMTRWWHAALMALEVPVWSQNWQRVLSGSATANELIRVCRSSTNKLLWYCARHRASLCACQSCGRSPQFSKRNAHAVSTAQRRAPVRGVLARSGKKPLAGRHDMYVMLSNWPVLASISPVLPTSTVLSTYTGYDGSYVRDTLFLHSCLHLISVGVTHNAREQGSPKRCACVKAGIVEGTAGSTRTSRTIPTWRTVWTLPLLRARERSRAQAFTCRFKELC